MDFQILNALMKMTKSFAHDQIKASGLNDTECMICSYVYTHEGCSQDDVSKALCMDKTTVTKSLQALENKGVLLRVSDKADKRRNALSLTKEGKEKCTRILHIHDEWIGKLMEVLDEEERKQFESYCRRLADAAKKMQEEGRQQRLENLENAER